MKKQKNIKYYIPLFFFLLLVIFLWLSLGKKVHAIPSPLIGKPIPAFKATKLPDPNKSITNNIFKGHISLLNVFATWCMSCRAEHPILIDIHNLRWVKIVGLNYRDKRQQAINWLKNYGNPYDDVIYDPQGRLAFNLGVYGTPETFIIDQKGIIRGKYVGVITPLVWKNDILPKIKNLGKTAP